MVAADTAPGSTAWTPDFERAAALRAAPLQGWSAELQRHERDLLLTLQADAPHASATPPPPIEVFPFAEQLLHTAVHEVYATPRGYAVKLRLMPDAAAPAALSGIVVAQGDGGAVWGGPKAYSLIKSFTTKPVQQQVSGSSTRRSPVGRPGRKMANFPSCAAVTPSIMPQPNRSWRLTPAFAA